MTTNDDFQLTWEGAAHPDGPWRHVRVVELHGGEHISGALEGDAADPHAHDLIAAAPTPRDG